ncbi:MAG: (2Fe-2S)-binding protein [Rubrivivax sp.]|nr:(2Fe-2S)-binding protein [Rubrivivax sp.]
MIVCLCHRISDRDIAREVQQGCANFEALQEQLCVATACGACHDCAQATFHQLCAGAPVAARPLAAVPVLLMRPLVRLNAVAA